MNSINIIIQSTKTERGLDIEHNSFGDSAAISKLAESLADERDIPFKAGDKDAYCIQISGDYKIYSLIIGNTDFAGRPGYITIKLYCQRNKNIQNFESILNEIKVQYESNSSFSNAQKHNYTDIISRIIENRGTQNVLNISKEGKFFLYFDKDLSQLERDFNTDLIFLVDKLYAFQRPNEEKSQIAELKSITLLEGKIDRQIIRGDLRLIPEIKINNQKVDFDQYQDTVTILLRENQNMTYSKHSKASTKRDGNDIVVSPKYVEPPRPKSTAKSYWGFVFGCLSGLIVGFGTCYYFFPTIIYQNDTEQAETVIPSPDLQDSISVNKEKYKFSHPALSDYSFKNDKGKWSYSKKSHPDRFAEFYKSTLDSFKYKAKAISKETKELFLEKLEAKSNTKIEDKPKKIIITKTEKSTSVSKKTEHAPEKNASKPTKKEAEKSKSNYDVEVLPTAGKKSKQ